MRQALQSQCEEESRAEELARETVEICALSLTYCLKWNGRGEAPAFYVSVTTLDDKATAWAGNDRALAERYYAVIKSGSVTPCTLQEVMDDLQWESRMV